MIAVGDVFPQFKLKAVDGKKIDEMNIDNVFVDIDENIYRGKKWLTIFFYPKDFTFVCPTEIVGFGNLNDEFSKRNSVLVAASTDSEFTHWAWRKHQKELRDLTIPILADIKRELSEALGILDKNEGVAQRAVFIVDSNGIVRFSMVTDLKVGRNPKEILRVLDALQKDELCPCNWNKGEETINLKKATSS